jgi:hypothetical protein
MNRPKQKSIFLFCLIILSLALTIDFLAFHKSLEYSFDIPKKIYPVFLVQKIENNYYALNLSGEPLQATGVIIPPATITKFNKLMLTEIKNLPTSFIWRGEKWAFPSNFAKRAPDVAFLEEKATCPICKISDFSWEITRGNYNINNLLVIPFGVSLKIEAGTILNFSDEGGILSRSPIVAKGTKGKPIIFRGGRWKGISVINQGTSPSVLNYVEVQGGTGFDVFGMRFTGTVNLILGQTILDHVKIHKSLAEDALNLKWTYGVIKDLFINESSSDAIDIDWSTLKISHLEVKVAGNDCLDLSGGKTQILFLNLQNCGDKAISNGENNILEGSDLLINKAKTGIANKDGGILKVQRLQVTNVKKAFHQYHQKKFYAKPSATIDKFFRNANKHIEAGLVETI